jgi:HSP20 family protein
MAEVAVTKTPEKGVFPKSWGAFPAFPNWTFGTSPFTLMRDFSREMDRFFHGHGITTAGEAGVWWPAVEWKKTNGTFLVKAEVPGLKKEDVKVEVAEGCLILEGERKYESKKEEEGFFQTERSYGKFYRSIPLPEGAKPEEIKAELANGVLEVKVPVIETKPKMRQIPIEETARKG